jgi:hypothetical protein
MPLSLNKQGAKIAVIRTLRASYRARTGDLLIKRKRDSFYSWGFSKEIGVLPNKFLYPRKERENVSHKKSPEVALLPDSIQKFQGQIHNSKHSQNKKI